MSGEFAKGTSVPVSRSRAEIEAMLSRCGATSFASGWSGNDATIVFECQGRRVRFDLPLPNVDDRRFTHKKNRRGYDEKLSDSARDALHAAEHRRRWRALALVIKAKLEAVASGITTFEDEFLAHIVVPGGKTFGDWARPEIARAYDTGAALPPLLGSGS
jgi:hypothetical protein